MPSAKRPTLLSFSRNSRQITAFIALVAALTFSPNASALDCDYKISPPDATIVESENPTTDEGVTSAWYGGATTVYAHGVLGDAIEANTLYVTNIGSLEGCALALTLHNDSVFEDVTPRIADVTGDGENNVITIESHQKKGASLAVYGIKNNQLVKIASAPHIGLSYRWLAPVGMADFNGDGVKDVAYVQTPHIGGILKIWSFKSEAPELLASKRGFSNHRIGENFITGGLRFCDDKVELVLPDQSWRKTLIVRKDGDSAVYEVYADNTDKSTIRQAIQCL